jgi:hypothetical protein
VVVGGDPEDRYDRPARGRLEAPGQGDRGEGLVKRVEGPTEEPRLLARHNHRTVRTLESLQRFERSAFHTEGFRLAAQDGRHPGAPVGGVAAGGRRSGDSRRVPEIDRIEIADPLGRGKEIPVERAGMEKVFEVRGRGPRPA